MEIYLVKKYITNVKCVRFPNNMILTLKWWFLVMLFFILGNFIILYSWKCYYYYIITTLSDIPFTKINHMDNDNLRNLRMEFQYYLGCALYGKASHVPPCNIDVVMILQFSQTCSSSLCYKANNCTLKRSKSF